MSRLNSADTAGQRREMVKSQLAARGITDSSVLEAFRRVPREEFVGPEFAEFAYKDTPLPIGEGQTISQPLMVAIMTEALELGPRACVLEIGTGCGYAAAVLSCIADRVYTIERHRELADSARERLQRLGFHNVEVLCGDGTRGWPEHAPFDAIVVAAGGPDVPQSLRKQLAVGGRLVIPIGKSERSQTLKRVVREDEHEFRTEDLGGVRFVPLIGEEGWKETLPQELPKALFKSGSGDGMSALIRETAEPLESIERAELDALVERIGDARVVLIGEATHGTSEFYRMRAKITQELVSRKGFNIVGIEGDWPDAMHVHRYISGREAVSSKHKPFARFPTWMWRNSEVVQFLEWLREHNSQQEDPRSRAGFYGLDLYSLFSSIEQVIAYLERIDKRAAEVARLRYGCLSPWENEPSRYGLAALTDRYRSCEQEVVSILTDMLQRRIEYQQEDGERYFDVVQNARVVAGAEQYYRAMYYGRADSWNLRDTHMFETLLSLLSFRGKGSKAVVWAHNSHVGNARATEMGARGEHNIGQLCRGEFGEQAYALGFGTDRGTVAAASNWDEEMQVMQVRPARRGSYEGLCRDSRLPAFLLPLREPKRAELRHELMEPRLSRAIGVIYRPETELQSHYYQAVLPVQFDEWIWFDETSAVHPFDHPQIHGLPDTYPSGL